MQNTEVLLQAERTSPTAVHGPVQDIVCMGYPLVFLKGACTMTTLRRVTGT